MLALWLFYGGEKPDRSDAGGLIDRLYDLEGLVSEVGLAVAVSFVAYLVGTLTEWATTAVLRTRVARGLTWFDEYLRSQAETAVLEQDADSELIGRSLNQIAAEDFTTSDLRDELAAIRTSLMVDHPVIYDDYDRLRAEAEFRIAILLPLSLLLYILGQHFDSAFYLGFGGVVALGFQAHHYERRATAALIQSVISEKVTPQYVEQVLLELSRQHRRKRATASA